MSWDQVPSSPEILNRVIRKHNLTGSIEEINQKLAEMLVSSIGNIEAIRSGEEEISFTQGARLARILDKIPLMYIACAGFNKAKKEQDKTDQELWYTILYRNTDIGL